MWLKKRVGLGQILGPSHMRYFGVPFGRVPDDPDHSTQAFGKKPAHPP